MSEPKKDDDQKTPAQAAQAARAQDPQYATAAAVAAVQARDAAEAEDRAPDATLADPMPARNGGGRRGPAARPEEPKAPQVDTNALAAAIVAAQMAVNQGKGVEPKPDADETVKGGLYVVDGRVVDAHGVMLTHDDLPDGHAETLNPRVRKQLDAQSAERRPQPQGE